MREAAAPVDVNTLNQIANKKGRKEGNYGGGLCDIVGTGGDSHSTFNISTTSSIIASSLLLLSKHGNRASTSKSGSADLLSSTTPRSPVITSVTPQTINEVYKATNYAFLFAPVFHPGMKYVAPIRKELGWRTIFNLLGPLTNPVEGAIEARVIGVARRDLAPVFANALRLTGVKKAMVICGEEELDELSCAGRSFCYQLVEKTNPTRTARRSGPDENEQEADDSDSESGNIVEINAFSLTPEDFGLPAHPLSEVSPGKEPRENAAILMRILRGEMAADDPILHFVLMNTAALFVVSGICESDTSDMGPGDDGKVVKERGPGGGRWKEGVRRARWAVDHGAALKEWEAFVDITNNLVQ
ncbi:anthranilate phosphoribosyltransferase [Patellaria atrata CBS 101060]|uniref:Anthranilate phosphoribosyltransferase n=1 Tax=Patellaria atrata CBS 101060 TaxID=1346257 RepID=A0A9P4VV19_9PEZI|nr:anthranilate phosphoribosyltransferase [Patellaria atrata CBS 101060]